MSVRLYVRQGRPSNDALQYIVLHRVQPHTQKGYILVAHCAFQKGSKDRGFSECYRFLITCECAHLMMDLRSHTYQTSQHEG